MSSFLVFSEVLSVRRVPQKFHCRNKQTNKQTNNTAILGTSILEWPITFAFDALLLPQYNQQHGRSYLL
jgi:uncharacterized protein YceK